MPISRQPETQHRLRLADRELTYRLRRSNRRTIGLTVDQDGLRVAAPQRARLGDIEQLLGEHQAWIARKLDDWQDRLPEPRLQVQDGLVLFLAGEPLTVTIDSLRQRAYVRDPVLKQLVLNGVQPPREALLNALKQEARRLFSERVQWFAGRLGVAAPVMRLSSAKTRWGSCNQRGQISLNWRLILLPLPIIDYVVAHELAHLKEMNHSPRFWAVVAQLCPDWATRRQTLKQLAGQLPMI